MVVHADAIRDHSGHEASGRRRAARPTGERLRDVLREVHEAPLLRGIASGGVVLLAGTCVRRSPEGVVLGVATAMLERSLTKKAFTLQRAVRNAEDVAMVASHLEPDFPPLGTWAIEADFARLVAQELDHGADVVLELGSGVSTLLIASILNSRNSGRLISVDHDHRFASETRARLERAGITDRVELVVAPLRPQAFGSITTDWYDTAAVLERLTPRPIDLLIVDGPPSTSHWARWPAMEVLRPRLSEHAVVLLDDGRQRRERSVALRWARDHPDLELYWVDTLKGTWRLKPRLRPTESATTRLARQLWRTMNPNPVGFGRWPVRR